jgi:hypothetical protein
LFLRSQLWGDLMWSGLNRRVEMLFAITDEE